MQFQHLKTGYSAKRANPHSAEQGRRRTEAQTDPPSGPDAAAAPLRGRGRRRRPQRKGKTRIRANAARGRRPSDGMEAGSSTKGKERGGNGVEPRETTGEEPGCGPSPHYHLLDPGQADLGNYRTVKDAKAARSRIVQDKREWSDQPELVREYHIVRASEWCWPVD